MAPSLRSPLIYKQDRKILHLLFRFDTCHLSCRGGTMAVFDAGINIETSVVDGKRMATRTKNRYGKTGVKYFIDERKIESEA